MNNFQEYTTNFLAIMESKKIPKQRKKNLLENILEDIKFVFTKEYENVKCSENKKEVIGLISSLENKLNLIYENVDPNFN